MLRFQCSKQELTSSTTCLHQLLVEKYIPDTSKEPNEFNSSHVSDLEEGTPCLGSLSVPEKDKDVSITSRIIDHVRSVGLQDINKILFITTLIRTRIVIFSPAHIKKKRNENLKHQLDAAKESLNQKYESLQKAMDKDNDKLSTELYEMVGLVSKGHHDREIKEKDEQLLKITQDNEQNVKMKQAEIDALKAQIEKEREEMEKMKAIINNNRVNNKNFCDECKMETMANTCRESVDYLDNKCKTSEQDALDLAVKESPSCYKANRINTINFCDECKMETMENTCRERADYLRNTYNTPEHEAMDLAVKESRSWNTI